MLMEGFNENWLSLTNLHLYNTAILDNSPPTNLVFMSTSYAMISGGIIYKDRIVIQIRAQLFNGEM